MKKGERIYKAIIVILIVGIGLINNINKTTGNYYCYTPFHLEITNQTQRNDSVKTNESRLYILTKKIIDTGIKYLIP